MKRVAERVQTRDQRVDRHRWPIIDLPATAWDTETTGLDMWHGCEPFMVIALDEDGQGKVWEWHVNPHTRKPLIRERDRRQIRAKLAKTHNVFHNCKFDIRALDLIDVLSPEQEFWDRTEDTQVASHVVNSDGPHKLEVLADKFLTLDSLEEKELQQAVIAARRIAKKKKWRSAKPGDPHWPATRSFSGNKAAWKMDAWLPRCVAYVDNYPKDHPWWTICRRYCLQDVMSTLGVWFTFKEAMTDEDQWRNYELKRKQLRITYEMEQRGVPIHEEKLKEASLVYGHEAVKSTNICLKLAKKPNLNLGSSQQLQRVLYEDLGFKPTKKTDAGKKLDYKPGDPEYATMWSTDKEALIGLEGQFDKNTPQATFIKYLRLSRKYAKAVEYLESYLLNGIPIGSNNPDNRLSWAHGYSNAMRCWRMLHGNFNVVGTATTRFSAYDPNTQNVSKQEDFNLRRVFVPLPGRRYYSIDYENIEFRIFAYESGDKRLIEAFEQGFSMHLVIAEALHPQLYRRLGPEKFKKTETYRWIKNGNFALIYGGSPWKVNITYRVPGAYEIIKKKLSKLEGFMRARWDEGKKYGYITTLGGYRLVVPKNAPHKAANYFVQGSAGEIMMEALVKVYNYLQSQPDHYMNMVIHDEIDYDFPDDDHSDKVIHECGQLMASCGDAVGIPTPVSIDRWNSSWADEVGVPAVVG